MSLGHPPSPLDGVFYWVTTHRSGIGKALAFGAPVVVFVVVVTSFTGGAANNLARPARTSAATTIPAQPRVQVADAPQSPTGQPAAIAATTTAPALSATPTPSPVPAGAATYTVVSGDIPLTIAQKLNVPGDQRLDWAHQLLALNNMSSTELQVGQVLKLPANTPSGDHPGTLQPTVTTTPAPPPLPSPE